MLKKKSKAKERKRKKKKEKQSKKRECMSSMSSFHLNNYNDRVVSIISQTSVVICIKPKSQGM